jgi:2-phospho-L-lactate guanylyltransferase (CobY/MobA/RfbA family)
MQDLGPSSHPPTAQEPLLVIFTLGAERDAQRHPLLPSALRLAEVALRAGCLTSAVEAGWEAGCQVQVCSPEPFGLPAGVAWSKQCGDGFGERFANALAKALAERRPVVAVGADVPGLDAHGIRRALGVLLEDPDRVVVGPSPDGGFYLLAAARPLGSVLASVRWCGREARRTLVEALRRTGRPVVLLAPLADLDRPADLERWVASGPTRLSPLQGSRTLLRRLLAERYRPMVPPEPSLPAPPLLSPLCGRAPPLCP